jgi:hypothetical protein
VSDRDGDDHDDDRSHQGDRTFLDGNQSSGFHAREATYRQRHRQLTTVVPVTPQPISSLAKAHLDGARTCIVAGEILAQAPPRAVAVAPPFGLTAHLSGREPVVSRTDLEETRPFVRPELERIERGRNFYVSDGTGRALVRVTVADPDRPGVLADDLELHLAQPFAAVPIATVDAGHLRTAYLRTLTVGDRVVVAGRLRLEADALAAAGGGYRDLPRIAAVEATALYDEPAWINFAAWRALPWYRKLSLLVRNR